MSLVIDASIKERLRVRAVQNGRSMEAEARATVAEAVASLVRSRKLNLYDRIRARVEPFGGVDLELLRRIPAREPPTFE